LRQGGALAAAAPAPILLAISSPQSPGATAAMNAQPPDDAIRFAVLDDEDLSVMSAHLQDAVLRPANVTYLASTKRFVLVVARLDWRCVASGKPARREAGFHFEHVRRVRQLGFGRRDPADQLQLLAVSFEPTDAPAGTVLLTFAGGAMIRLEVECLEAEMHDLGPCWPVDHCPRHHLDEAAAAG
jgi:hypothetical protein